MRIHPVFRASLRTMMGIICLCCIIQAHAQIPFTIKSCTQVSYLNPFFRPVSSDFELNFSYNNPPPGIPYFLNAYIRVPFTTIEGWMIQNVLLDSFSNDRELTYTMKLGELGYNDGVPINLLDISYFITDTVMKDPITVPPGSYNPLPVVPSVWDWGSGLNIDSILTVLNLLPPNDFHKTDSVRTVTRGCHMPNIDLDSLAHNAGTTAGYAGDWNSCVPTSCANSMEWLEARHPSAINSGLTHRQKLEELSKLMKRKRSEGVRTDTMVKAKLEYIDKYKLPIHVKFQDLFIKDSCLKSFDTTSGHCATNMSKDLNDAAKPKLDYNWLFEEMKKGEDVEMLVQWVVDSAGTLISRSGHAVVLSGVSEINGVTQITIKDDSLQGGPGGTRERPLTFDTTGTAKYPVIKEWGWVSGVKKSTCYVTGWVSESYDTSIKFLAVNEILSSDYGLSIAGNPMYEGQVSVISFTVPANTKLHIAVYDLLGRNLKTLADGVYTAGKHKVEWNGATTDGSSIPPGIYFVVMNTENGMKSMKLLKQ